MPRQEGTGVPVVEKAYEVGIKTNKRMAYLGIIAWNRGGLGEGQRTGKIEKKGQIVKALLYSILNLYLILKCLGTL